MVTPLLEAATRVLPMRPSDVGWRFGAMGIVFNTLVTPLLGVFIAMVVAAVRGHRRTLRWLSGAAYAAAVVVTLGLVLFLFDYVQARAGVAAEQLAGLDVVSRKALFLGVVAVVAAGVLGRAGWNAGRTVETKRGSAANLLDMPGGAPE